MNNPSFSDLPMSSGLSTIPSTPIPFRPQNLKRPRTSTGDSILPSSPPNFSPNKESVAIPFSSSNPASLSGGTRKPKRRRQRKSEMDKLNEILDLMQTFKWSISDFLKQLKNRKNDKKIRKHFNSFLNFAYVDFVGTSDFEEHIGSRRKVKIIDKQAWRWTKSILSKEIVTLSEQSSFNKFVPPSQSQKLGSVEYLSKINVDIPSRAPHWLELIEALRTQSVVEIEGFDPESIRITGEHVVILAQLCHILRPYKASNIQAILGLYMYQGGSRRRVLDTFSHLGLVVGYTSIQRRMGELIGEAKRKIRKIGQSPAGIVTYDNFDFMEGKRGERTGDNRTMRSITTALMFKGRNFELGPLRQDMWLPVKYPLSAEEVFCKPDVNNRNEKIHLYHFESAIQALFKKGSTEIDFPWSNPMPVIHQIPLETTKYLPMKPIFKDESTTSNNIQILENIFLEQSQLKEDNPAHGVQLRLIYGDLKTWSRMQSVKALRRDISEQALDRFDWVLPCLGLWHLRFNMLQLIHKIHWGELGEADPSTLQYAADRWGRSRVVQPNDFQALEDLIIQSYQARVVGVWIKHLRRENVNPDRIELTLPWLEKVTSQSWTAMLKKMSFELQAPLLSTFIEKKPPMCDQEFENHQNFCAHVESYLTLRHAIKYADIGLLRHALRHVTILFQSSAAGTPKYAQALLYTIHTIHSSASAPRLQNTILMNGLVNLRGEENSNFEIDRLLELLNNNLKTYQRERSYFSRNSDTLLETWALNGPYFLAMKNAVEAAFGKINSSKHPEKSAAEDIWGMATNLAIKSLNQVKNDRFSINPTVNLYTQGLFALTENISKYNKQYLAESVSDQDFENIPESEIGMTTEPDQILNDSPLVLSSEELPDGLFID